MARSSVSLLLLCLLGAAAVARAAVPVSAPPCLSGAL